MSKISEDVKMTIKLAQRRSSSEFPQILRPAWPITGRTQPQSIMTTNQTGTNEHLNMNQPAHQHHFRQTSNSQCLPVITSHFFFPGTPSAELKSFSSNMQIAPERTRRSDMQVMHRGGGGLCLSPSENEGVTATSTLRDLVSFSLKR